MICPFIFHPFWSWRTPLRPLHRTLLSFQFSAHAPISKFVSRLKAGQGNKKKEEIWMLAVPKLGTRISIIKDRKSNNSLTCRHMSPRKVYDVQNTLFNYSDSGQGRLNRVEPEERLIISIMTCPSRDSSPRYYIRILKNEKEKMKRNHCISSLP